MRLGFSYRDNKGTPGGPFNAAEADVKLYDADTGEVLDFLVEEVQLRMSAKDNVPHLTVTVVPAEVMIDGKVTKTEGV